MVDKLVNYLKECSYSYYNEGPTHINDDTYDALVETLRRINPDHPYLLTVGAPVRENANKVGRLSPMGTLAKYHEEDGVKEWIEKEGGDILLTPKYDGFGVELTYENGRLVLASTRGNGYVGEDVTNAVKKIRNVPLEVLPTSLKTVRGECIIPRENHEKVKELGYSAMRNAVPGIVSSCREEALQYVDFVAYEFFDGNNDRKAQRDFYLPYFPVEEYKSFRSSDFEKILEIRNLMGDSKDHYLYEIDGMVLKSRIIKEDDLLCPNHQIAWKFPSNRRTTVLRDIEFNVGATGAISVIGIFDEVEFQGAKLKRASFGSLPLYEKMKPAIGDIVEVSRRGDIIPWIEEVAIRNSTNYKELKECPCCGTPLVDYACPNAQCPDRLKLKIYQYVKSIGIKGIGYATVVSMIDSGMLKSLPDIYKLDCVDILKLPRQGQSSVDKWLELQNKDLTNLDFLCALPIENAGKSVWKSLLARYDIEEIMKLTEEDLIKANIKGIGSSKINSIVSQLRESKEEILELIDLLNLY